MATSFLISSILLPSPIRRACPCRARPPEAPVVAMYSVSRRHSHPALRGDPGAARLMSARHSPSRGARHCSYSRDPSLVMVANRLLVLLRSSKDPTASMRPSCIRIT